MTGSGQGTSVLKVAVIGVGRMGVRHLQAAGGLGMVACGIADASTQALTAARDQFRLDESACFTDAERMLQETRPDAVVVATTAPTHARYVIAAARAGARYILCEKPMAASLAEVDAMKRACRETGALLAVNHQMRFMPQYTEVKALLTDEGIGPLVSMIVAGSNFGLAMNASHYFEAFRYVAGEEVHSVQAWLEPKQLSNPRGAEFDDRSGRVIARNAHGQTMYADLSADAGHGVQVHYVGRFGQIVVDELSGDMRIVARQKQYRDLPTTRYGMPADVTVRQIAQADTVVPTMAVWRGMIDGGDYPDAAAGEGAMACLVAAHVSHEAGGAEVSLAGSELPRERSFKWA